MSEEAIKARLVGPPPEIKQILQLIIYEKVISTKYYTWV